MKTDCKPQQCWLSELLNNTCKIICEKWFNLEQITYQILGSQRTGYFFLSHDTCTGQPQCRQLPGQDWEEVPSEKGFPFQGLFPFLWEPATRQAAAQAGALQAPAGTCLSWDTWNHLGYPRAWHRALDVQGDTAYVSKVLWMLLPQQIKHATCTQTTAALRGLAHSPSLGVQSPQAGQNLLLKLAESGLPFLFLVSACSFLFPWPSFPAVTNTTKTKKVYSARSTGAKHCKF